MNMFSKYILGEKLKNPKEWEEEDEHVFKEVGEKLKNPKEQEQEDRTSCQRNLLGGRLKNPKEQEEDDLVKGTYLVESSRTQRSSKKKKMNILSKELTWWKAQEPKEATRRRWTCFQRTYLVESSRTRRSKKKKMNIFSVKEEKEWTEETVVGTLALGRASASRWR
jgi:hypothetical protein